MSTKIKTTNGWETVGQIFADNGNHDIGKTYTFTASLVERTANNWFNDEASIDTSSLPDGIYVLSTRFAMNAGPNSCVGQLISNGFIGSLPIYAMSMVQGGTTTALTAAFIKKGTRGNTISVSRYNNAGSICNAQTIKFILTKIA